MNPEKLHLIERILRGFSAKRAIETEACMAYRLIETNESNFRLNQLEAFFKLLKITSSQGMTLSLVSIPKSDFISDRSPSRKRANSLP